MDINTRFDQLESLMVDFGRKQDQLIVEVRRQGELLGQQGELLGRQGEALGRIEGQLNNIEEQITDIITIFKISETRHTQTEQRQDSTLQEIKEQGRRVDEAMQIQLQMLQLLRIGNDKAEGLAQRLIPLEMQEPRIKHLEDEVFRAAS